MKAFHSNWTAPYLINSSLYEMKDYEILTTILSALKWREKNGSIKMITDRVGESYYKKIGAVRNTQYCSYFLFLFIFYYCQVVKVFVKMNDNHFLVYCIKIHCFLNS